MPTVAVVLLAAGRSTRFGAPGGHKLLAPIGGLPVVRWSVQRAVDAAVGEIVVVTGAEASLVDAALAGLPVRSVHASDYADGMASSLRRGVEAARDTADAIVVTLADQPSMRPEAYRRVVATWASTGAALVVPRYADAMVPGHPTLFAASVFEELLDLRGDVGARAVIARDPARVASAPIEWSAPRDIDTVEDLAQVTAELTEGRFRSARIIDRSGDSNAEPAR